MTEAGGTAQPSIYEGIRVIDFTHIQGASHCAKLLADMGAEVIKVEPPSGDEARALPYLKNGASGYFMWDNGGKKSLCLDLKHSKGVDVFKDLVKVSDVVVENRRVGVVDRLGIGYDDLKRVNPRIIMCSISGYGQNGPLAGQRGWELEVQVISAAATITGNPGGPPLPSWVPWVGNATATHAVGAVAAALYHRERTGTGQYVDLSMLDVAFSYHDFAIQEYLITEGRVQRTRIGPMHPTLFPAMSIYLCRGGFLCTRVTDASWGPLAELMGRPELATDPRFDSVPHRAENKEALYQVIAEWLKDLDVGEAKALLEAVEALGPPINTIAEIANHPQIEAREMLVEVDDPRAGKVKLPSSPLNFSETQARVRGRAPLLGEHNDDVLTSILGYSREQVEQLWSDKVLHAEEAVFTLRRT